MDACVFCLIRDGEAAHSLVHSDDLVLAFMDLYPVTPGHVLVVPRYEGDAFSVHALWQEAERTELEGHAARLRALLP